MYSIHTNTQYIYEYTAYIRIYSLYTNKQYIYEYTGAQLLEDGQDLERRTRVMEITLALSMEKADKNMVHAILYQYIVYSI
jgi:hypothetical protein